MAEWRLLGRWSNAELKERVDALLQAQRNFDAAEEDMTPDRDWQHYYSEAVVAREADGASLYFERAVNSLSNYQFSDPDIVMAHFDPLLPLHGRRMILEIKVLGLRYLCPAMVTRVRDEANGVERVFGFRYDTLNGHIERGVEWFQLTRASDGCITFRIEARWRPGQLPNWWSRAGFSVLSGHYQRKWHRQAHRRMSLLAHYGSLQVPRAAAARLTHRGLDVRFTYNTKR